MKDSVTRSRDRADFFGRLMDSQHHVLGERRLPELEEDELYILQDFLWASHQDCVQEWSRRDMMRRSPVDPASYR